jgi:3-hydroxyacyl-CoA dehydrogenase/3a,7a,12a-trihydroxy-5b-cholest-24-enoyl-CoA hydratase
MTHEDWDKVLAVHLGGAYHVTKAAWPHLREANYGRVVFTTSAAGLYGNFGQANYSAAKLAIVGLAKTLAHEGMKNNIRANVIAPIAGSRMTETIMPPELVAKLKPEYVSPLVAYLCSEGCEETAQIYAVGGGYVSRVAIVEAKGAMIDVSKGMTPEAVLERWAQINDLGGATPPANAMEAAGRVMQAVQ